MTKVSDWQGTSSSLFKGTMIYCGAHYSRCPVEIREIWTQGFALPDGAQELKRIVGHVLGDNAAEMVVISTCNRFDLCLFGQLNRDSVQNVFIQFAQWTLSAAPRTEASVQKYKNWKTEIGNWLRIWTDEKALHQLFRVGASLDSLVLGEPHILGQLKDAFQSALAAGTCQQEATGVFNRTFQIAKRVRTETELGKSGVSIGHAAVEIVQRVFDNLSNHSCLILGAGEMAKITAQHLQTCGAGSITIANRTIATAQRLAEQIPNCKAINLSQGLSVIGGYNIIIAATSAQDFILRKELHAEQLARRKVGTPCVLVDISVPRNIDPALGKLDNIFVFDVDDLDKVMESNRKSREKAAVDAENIIKIELEEFISHRRQRENLVNVGRFHQWVRQIVVREIEKSLRNPEGMTETQIQITADAVAKKMVAHPALLARTDSRLDSGSDSVGEVLRALFKLDQHERGSP